MVGGGVKGTLALSRGPWGGFYVTRSRVCLGFVAITLLPDNEIDELMERYSDYWDLREDVEGEVFRLRLNSMDAAVTREKTFTANRLARALNREPLDDEGSA